jgi:hypothetical protein
MVPEKYTAELEKYKDILLATIDYELEKAGDHLKSDQVYLSQKKFIETNYQQEGLQKLKKRLQHSTDLLKQLGDLNYNRYIKEKTGHDFDIFENIQERINKIFVKNKISNRNEMRDAIAMIQLYRKTSAGETKALVLQNLLTDYQSQRSK